LVAVVVAVVDAVRKVVAVRVASCTVDITCALEHTV
jgi:hypothetical protein